jgi:hypothetical protein
MQSVNTDQSLRSEGIHYWTTSDRQMREKRGGTHGHPPTL